MKRLIYGIVVAGVLTAGSLVATTLVQTAQAGTEICQQYGTSTIQNRYIVQNNRWGNQAEQCIDVNDTGFSVARQDGSNPTNGSPVSYPSIYLGCHYSHCSPGSNLPLQLSRISSVTSSIDYKYVSGATYDAAYDIWLDPSPRTDGHNQVEVMIWFNRQGQIQPVGQPSGNVTIGGRSWQVWNGGNGSGAVISYVAPAALPSWNFSVLDFLNDVRSQGKITNDWYLTSVQAGFEPWQGGTGLTVNSFAVNING